jgi:hypothetical protein
MTMTVRACCWYVMPYGEVGLSAELPTVAAEKMVEADQGCERMDAALGPSVSRAAVPKVLMTSDHSPCWLTSVCRAHSSFR